MRGRWSDRPTVAVPGNAEDPSVTSEEWMMPIVCTTTSLVMKDLVYETKAKTFFLKAKAKDMKIFRGQDQDLFLKAKAT